MFSSLCHAGRLNPREIADVYLVNYYITMSLSRNRSHAAESHQEVRNSSIDPWEEAYLQFETPEDEIRKFTGRLRRLGVSAWPKDTRVIELFCGRGNGLRAWEKLGFRNLEGVDLSPRLIAKYDGPAKCYVADCRHLPFSDASRDAAVVQGGLHHLSQLPEDLEQALVEIRRVLTRNGRVLFVEPWRTSFLTFVHFVANRPALRRFSVKLDALATMIEHERRTYEQWLNQPELITDLARKHFVPLHESFAWGKWTFCGKPRG